MLREITDVEIAAFDRLRRGLDWGYAVDPLHYTVNHYDRTRRRLYIFYELRAQGMSNRRLAEEINRENPKHREVICDSADRNLLRRCANTACGDWGKESTIALLLWYQVDAGLRGNHH